MKTAQSYPKTEGPRPSESGQANHGFTQACSRRKINLLGLSPTALQLTGVK